MWRRRRPGRTFALVASSASRSAGSGVPSSRRGLFNCPATDVVVGDQQQARRGAQVVAFAGDELCERIGGALGVAAGGVAGFLAQRGDHGVELLVDAPPGEIVEAPRQFPHPICSRAQRRFAFGALRLVLGVAGLVLRILSYQGEHPRPAQIGLPQPTTDASRASTTIEHRFRSRRQTVCKGRHTGSRRQNVPRNPAAVQRERLEEQSGIGSEPGLLLAEMKTNWPRKATEQSFYVAGAWRGGVTPRCSGGGRFSTNASTPSRKSAVVRRKP